ncbi:MAG: hypothetical protein ISR81_03775 [Nitrosopumilus sp.]|nr:hypothetical protein [Nitrosopumilus sp.]MBL7018015.1 hypothetical protein [Nitrosopumilus sp.]
MNIEEAITKCEITLKQIKQYDPDPYYVNYFFNEYMISINNIINGIFEEANRDFGLFVSEKISEQKFYEKAKMKNDENAIKFSEWYSKKYIEEHKNPYPDVISQVRNFKNKFKKLPEIKIMLRASERYKDDINQEIKVKLSNQKLKSRDELDIEIKRQLPIFLQVLNHKRDEKNEPKIEENQVIASAFIDIENHEDVEIAYAAEIYIPVMERLVEESRKRIKELIR